MQTRRRLQTQSDHVLLQHQTDLDATNPLIVGTAYGEPNDSRTTVGTNFADKRNPEEVSLLIGTEKSSKTSLSLNIDGGSVTVDDDHDDKYRKAERQWNFRTISSRLQATSGLAIRSLITNPLSVAASAVKGNFQSEYQASVETSAAQFPTDCLDLSEDLDSAVPTVMAARDRTGEFNNAIRSFQSRNITRAINVRDVRKAKQVQSYGEFMMTAKLIGKNIASTYAKLEKLTMCKYQRI